MPTFPATFCHQFVNMLRCPYLHQGAENFFRILRVHSVHDICLLFVLYFHEKERGGRIKFLAYKTLTRQNINFSSIWICVLVGTRTSVVRDVGMSLPSLCLSASTFPLHPSNRKLQPGQLLYAAR